MINLKKIIIAEHYGFCMGVKRAISLVNDTMAAGGKVTIFKEIVHNEAIVKEFEKAGLGKSSAIDDIDHGTLIIPAHGAAPEIFRKAAEHGLRIVDATCPLVIRIHKIIRKLAENGYHVLHFGDPEHDETVGIVGQAPGKVNVIHGMNDLERVGPFDGKLALTSQTTARAADFEQIQKQARRRFPQVEVFNTICNATNQLQAAVMNLAPRVDMMLIVGSKTSANSKRLAQISQAICGYGFLIDTAENIKPEWFQHPDRKIETVGLSAGASTPDFLIEGAIEKLKEMAKGVVEVVYPSKKSGQDRPALKDDVR